MLNPNIYDPRIQLSNSEDKRPTLLLKNFAESHNKLRIVALESFKDLYTSLRVISSPPGDTKFFETYLKAMAQSKFVLSPPGKRIYLDFY